MRLKNDSWMAWSTRCTLRYCFTFLRTVYLVDFLNPSSLKQKTVRLAKHLAFILSGEQFHKPRKLNQYWCLERSPKGSNCEEKPVSSQSSTSSNSLVHVLNESESSKWVFI